MRDFEEMQRPRPQFKAAQETLEGGQKVCVCVCVCARARVASSD